MKLLTAFLKREHGVAPRVFDEAVYAVYHLPLLPGYGQNVNIRSSPAVKSPGGKSILSKMSEAEEYGYDGTYFAPGSPSNPYSFEGGGYISSSPPTSRKPHRRVPQVRHQSDPDHWQMGDDGDIADVVFFDYGVVVFFGLDETQEQDILEDLYNAGVLQGRRSEDDWEMEECHYEHDPSAPSPRIYNDFFTFKSSSHLLKLSLAHALAQSTLLAHYETIAQVVLAAPSVTALPKQLANSGELKLRRGEALKLTGRLFKLRRDVNLVSNVLDTPELFWSEASLKSLYDATRDYFELEPRVQVLNERLGVASDLLDIIHEHLNNGAMMRITWIIIWLIVVACLVDLGEVLARLVVHFAQPGGKGALQALQATSVHDATMALEKLMLIAQASDDPSFIFVPSTIMDSEDILADSFSIMGETRADPSEAGIVRVGQEGKANTLLADAVFSPSLFLAEQIQTGKVDLKGKTVLELGSGAALPLLLSATIESHPLLITLTDYPDETIISILHQNLASSREQIKPGCSINAVGYAWGADVSPLLSLVPEGYDVLVLSDLLHFDSSHSDILSTVTRTLKRSPDAWVYLAAGLYTHKSVREAFLKAGEEAGLEWTSIENDGVWKGETRVTSDGEAWAREDLNARKANVVAWIGRWR
ncbi:unnamed protein product [Rhizoctonia solani]|uniref:DUF155 domain-containing protein n=1 Tax=Rhizoctonia solani TaxID=456999 RepID=A0A8H2XKF1_9AGAM|nr:unnamed protein product [Rhizoctonia solani]